MVKATNKTSIVQVYSSTGVRNLGRFSLKKINGKRMRVRVVKPSRNYNRGVMLLKKRREIVLRHRRNNERHFAASDSLHMLRLGVHYLYVLIKKNEETMITRELFKRFLSAVICSLSKKDLEQMKTLIYSRKGLTAIVDSRGNMSTYKDVIAAGIKKFIPKYECFDDMTVLEIVINAAINSVSENSFFGIQEIENVDSTM